MSEGEFTPSRDIQMKYNHVLNSMRVCMKPKSNCELEYNMQMMVCLTTYNKCIEEAYLKQVKGNSDKIDVLIEHMNNMEVIRD